MGYKNIKLKPNDTITKCPECGNNTFFVARSEQVCEDGCDVWVRCKCGYDPTAESIGYRLEDVLGSLDEGNILTALDIWNDMIELKSKPLPRG